MAILGLRGSGSFAAGERPKNYRQGILLLFPNGDAPLTALLSKGKEQPTDDPQFYWYGKGLPIYRAQITGVSTTLGSQPAASNTTQTTTNSGSGFAQLALRVVVNGTVDASIFKAGHVIYDEEHDVSMQVMSVQGTTTAAWLVVETINSRNQVGASNPITSNSADASADHLVIIGSGFPEGAPVGQSIAYQPSRDFNYTQIFRDPLGLTRTAKKTRLRWDTEGPYREARREALQQHGCNMERGFLYGERAEMLTGFAGTGSVDSVYTANGTQPLRLTRGILNWLPAITTATVSVHTDLSQFNSSTLTEAIWDNFLEEGFRYGSREKACFVGSTALNVINQLSKNKATINMVPRDRSYGMAMMEYLTPFGTLYLINHPLLSDDPTWRKDLYLVDMDKLTFRYITDTTFLMNRQNPGDDASKDEWLTEAGLECHFGGGSSDTTDGMPNITLPSAHARLKGVGVYGG